MISQELDLHIGKLELVTIILSIHIFNHNIYNTETLGIIIAHGYSTASSVADITNTLLGYRLFEAVDMPYNSCGQNQKNNAHQKKYQESHHACGHGFIGASWR